MPCGFWPVAHGGDVVFSGHSPAAEPPHPRLESRTLRASGRCRGRDSGLSPASVSGVCARNPHDMSRLRSLVGLSVNRSLTLSPERKMETREHHEIGEIRDSVALAGLPLPVSFQLPGLWLRLTRLGGVGRPSGDPLRTGPTRKHASTSAPHTLNWTPRLCLQTGSPDLSVTDSLA